ncbi:MAG TPA: class I SAM-dependent methyltransferase [Gaiellaceae bacterium]|nr:class I SAM-dependent methyltransferase [Gaiellaceae bacterium]
MREVLAENAESQRAWDGVLFDRFVQYRHLLVDGLAAHGAAAIERFPPPRGGRVLDIGCGFGDSTCALAELVGPDGSALGVDISPRFVELARSEASELGVANVRFEVADVQAHRFEETFDYAFSRFGTMFFASPVAALRNVHAALQPGSRFVSVVWRRREDNEFLYVAEQVVKPLVPEKEDTSEARCGPGPFFLADADLTTRILLSAGFRDIELHRRDMPIKIGATVDEAVEMNLAVGPAAEAVRLAEEEGERLRPQLAALLRDALRPLQQDDGVYGASSVWIVAAIA